ncbi:hypothetical protein EV361DRAFT_941121, partial [Lentinula raphanica]
DSTRIDTDSSYPTFKKRTWPPSLSTFGFIAMGSSMLYNRAFSRFSEWVLGMKQPAARGFEFRRQEGPDGAEQEAVLQVQRDVPEAVDMPFANLNGATQYPNISMMIGLLKPFIASGIGHLLYLGAQHSRTLRFCFTLYTSPKLIPELTNNTWYWRYYTEAALGKMDPVWIRNSVGLGILIVIRDSAHLFHLWLTKREMASRRLKNRDFAGVELKELDLVQRPNPTT